MTEKFHYIIFHKMSKILVLNYIEYFDCNKCLIANKELFEVPQGSKSYNNHDNRHKIFAASWMLKTFSTVDFFHQSGLTKGVVALKCSILKRHFKLECDQ